MATVSRRTKKSTPWGVLLLVVLFLVAATQLDPIASWLGGDRLDLDATSLLVVKPTTAAPNAAWDPHVNPLGIPQGQAPNLPSVRVADKALDTKRKIYGGEGDAKHLGGFTDIDLQGVSPRLWKNMVSEYGIHSVMDVGCGRGISTSWFLTHGLDVLCVEGSHDAVTKQVLPDSSRTVEHDFSRGPWWPAKTYDAVWAVEFLEHVNLQYHYNYITTFRKAALIFATSSRWGGWHHVEVHPDEWWIQKYEAYGFRYSESLTKQARAWAKEGNKDLGPNGQVATAQHLWTSLKVFVNPAVAALPEHAHLFATFGCYQDRKDDKIVNRECGTGKEGHMETPLDPSFYPIKLTPEMDKAWDELILKHVPKVEPEDSKK